MRRHGIGDAAVVVDLLDDADDFRRYLLVELHIAFELGDDRSRQRLDLDALAGCVLECNRFRFVIVGAIGVLEDLRALGPLDQDLDDTVGQLEQLQHACKRADLEDRVRCRIVVGGVLLCPEEDKGVAPHYLFEGADRLLTPDQERHHHVRENHGVSQRQNRVGPDFTGDDRRTRFCIDHGPKSLLSLVAPLCSCPL